MNVLFLDYDGVVNTPQWSVKNEKWRCRFNMPSDNTVNDVQCVQWLSEFCEKYDYAIVVTSTWRFHPNYKDCLTNAGLRHGINILGATPNLPNQQRGDEIQAWLNAHPDTDAFIILDDDSDMGALKPHLIRCRADVGFREQEFRKACKLHRKLSRPAKP